VKILGHLIILLFLVFASLFTFMFDFLRVMKMNRSKESFEILKRQLGIQKNLNLNLICDNQNLKIKNLALKHENESLFHKLANKPKEGVVL